MQKKRDSKLLSPDSNELNRRQLLQALGALVATSACSAVNEGIAGNASGTANRGGASGGASSRGGAASSGSDVGRGGSTIGGASPGSTTSNSANSGAATTGGTMSGGANTSGTTIAQTPAGGTNTGGTHASGGQVEAANGGSGVGGTSTSASGKGGASGVATTGGKGGTNATNTVAPGASSGGSSKGGTTSGSGGEGIAGANGSGGSLVAPSFDNVPTCSVSATDAAGQGPFLIHDKEKSDDISLYRQDIRGRYNQSAAPGVEMQLHLRVLDAMSTNCNGTPVEELDVYIWHTDAQGYYSGFGTPGGANEQHPDSPYAGVPSSSNLENTMRFCRGVQTTNQDGVVSFRSIFPGWYNGRDVHIHFVAFKRDSASRGRVTYTKQNSQNQWVFTTQFYFEPALTRSVHENNEPYKARTTGSLATTYQEAVKADEAGNSGLRAKATFANGVVVAQMQILLNPA